MTERTCPFCHSAMEQTSGGGLAVDTWECECCGARRSYGWERLPDPERLRERSAQLEQLAEEIEDSELAARLEA